VTYCCRPGIVWTREQQRTLLIDRETGASWTIEGIEAAVWDLLVLGYSYPRAAKILSLLPGVPAEEAREVVSTTLTKWYREGILEVTEQVRDGEPDDQ
jgi:hypothetical protein